MIDAGHIVTALLALITVQGGALAWMIRRKDPMVPILLDLLESVGGEQTRIKESCSAMESSIALLSAAEQERNSVESLATKIDELARKIDP